MNQKIFEAFDESQHPRGKTTDQSTPGSFAPKYGYETMLMELLKKAPGFTYSPLTKQQPEPNSKNYAVSPYKPRELVLDLDRLRPETIRKYAHDNRDLLYTDTKNNIGAWAEKGKVALDVSIVVKTQKEARALCKKFDQDAYFSFKVMDTVYVRKPRVLGGSTYAEGDHEGYFRLGTWEDDEGRYFEDVQDADEEGSDSGRDQGIGRGDEVESGLILTGKMRKDILDKVQRAIDSTLPQNVAEITTVMKNVGRTFTDQAVIARGFDFAGFPQGMEKFLDSYIPPLVDYTQGLIDKNTMDSIKQTLRDGVKNGIAPRELKDQIQAKFDNWTRSRPAVIARTEVGRIQVQTQIELIKERGDTKDIYLMWTTARDNRVRDSHMQVEDQVIKFGDRFSNDLRYPMDPEAPVEEVANCRCALVVLTPEMFDPLGIPKPPELRTAPEEPVPVPVPAAPTLPVSEPTLPTSLADLKWKKVKSQFEADQQLKDLGFIRESFTYDPKFPNYKMSIDSINSTMPTVLENMKRYKISPNRIQIQAEKDGRDAIAYVGKGVSYKVTPEEYIQLDNMPWMLKDGNTFLDTTVTPAQPMFMDWSAQRLRFNVASKAEGGVELNYRLNTKEANALWDKTANPAPDDPRPVLQDYWWPARKGGGGQELDAWEMLSNHEFAHIVQGQTGRWSATTNVLSDVERELTSAISGYSIKNLGELEAESHSTWRRMEGYVNMNDYIPLRVSGKPSRFTWNDLKRYIDQQLTDRSLVRSTTEEANFPIRETPRPDEAILSHETQTVLHNSIKDALEKFHIAITLTKTGQNK